MLGELLVVANWNIGQEQTSRKPGSVLRLRCSKKRLNKEVVMDEHVRDVLEHMQCRIPAEKLIGVAKCLPELAKLLWGHFQQEPCIGLNVCLAIAAEESQTLSVSTESSPVPGCAGDDSVAAEVCR